MCGINYLGPKTVPGKLKAYNEYIFNNYFIRAIAFEMMSRDWQSSIKNYILSPIKSLAK